MEIFVLWFVFAVVVGVAAAARGRFGFGWWLLAMLISPLLAVILLALMPRLDQAAADGETRPCPFCAEPIRIEAIKCKHCGSAVEQRVPSIAAYEVVDTTGAQALGRALGRAARWVQRLVSG